MLPSSSRVKLNRVALTDGLRLVPRRRRLTRSPSSVDSKGGDENQLDTKLKSLKDAASVPGRHEPVQASLSGPENVTESVKTANMEHEGELEENRGGTQKAKRKHNYQPCKRGASVKQEGPYTRGKYQQSELNTRSKDRLHGITKFCKLRLRFAWCFCTASDSAMFKRTEVRGPVRAKSNVKASVGKAGGGICKARVTRVAKRRWDRCRNGKDEVKARAAGCDPQPAAAKTGQVQTGTRSMPTGLSNIDRNVRPSPTGLAVSGGSMRRAVGASGCGLCGDCEGISPQQKTLTTCGQKSSSPGPEQPMVEVRRKKENTVVETPKKIVIWVNQYLQVPLCDIAQKCDALRHDCSYVLPDVLKTKVVHCFKQEMKAGFRPGRLGHEPGGESVLAEHREFCPRVESEKSACQPQSLTEHQRHPEECTDVQTLPGHTRCHFLNSCTSESSATCSASFLLGEQAKKGECRTGMLDRDVEEDSGSGSHPIGAEIHRDKRVKLGDVVKDGIVSSTQDLESKSPAKMDSSGKEKTCLEHEVGGSASFGPVVKENYVQQKLNGEADNPTETNAAQMSPELFCEENEVDMNEQETFTCQRVRAYIKTIKSSCARTYMSWPFANNDWKLTAHDVTTDCPAEPNDQSVSDDSGSMLAQSLPGSSSYRTNDVPPDSHTDASSGAAHQVSHQNEEKRGDNILAVSSGKTCGDVSLHSMEFAHHFTGAEETLANISLNTELLSNPCQCGREPGTDTVSATSSPLSKPETQSSTSTSSPSALGLRDLVLPVVKAVEKTLFHCEETQMTPWTSSCAPPPNSDSLESCESSFLLPQDEQEIDEGRFADRSPPILEPYHNASPINHGIVNERSLHNIFVEKHIEMDSSEFMLPPVLSPVTSPKGRSCTNLLPQNPDNDEEEKKEMSKDIRQHKLSPGCHMQQNPGNNEKSQDYLDKLEGASNTTLRRSSGSDEDDDGNGEESQDETDCEDDVEQSNKTSEQVPADPKMKATFTSGALTNQCSSLSSDEDDGGVFSNEGQLHSARGEASISSEIAGSERDESHADAAGDTQHSILDEFTAYEQDILLVDVIQEDPELFKSLPQGSLLKPSRTRNTAAPTSRPAGQVKTLSSRTDGASLDFKQRLTSANNAFHWRSPSLDTTEEGISRSWRPQCSSSTSKPQSNMWPTAEKQTKVMDQPDANNNYVNGVVARRDPIQTMTSLHNHIPSLINLRNGPLITNPANKIDFRRQKFNSYCRQYFSESLSCEFKMCRFQHVPVEGDEKLCIETVTRFTKNPMCLQRACAVFTGYYQNNPTGVYFSMPVLLSLLWALLKAGMVSDVFSVLSVSLSHKIVPSHEFLLALFNIVREKGLNGAVPELMQLTFKMASTGLVLSLDCLDSVRNTPDFQEMVNLNPHLSGTGNHKLPSSAPFPEYLNLAQSIVEIELCTKQEDWKRMGEVFRSICQTTQHPSQVERISGRIAIALLSESKDKLSLPFAVFADAVCQNEGDDILIKSFLGRIGVSLMLRYHKTHQWAKGQKVVEMLSNSKISYSTLKGLFGNEDGSSRCCLVTVATELFLLSGSLEGALHTLRENEWFMSSCSWPCEPADLDSRTRVLMRLAEKTSHRDTLEVLCNLPGLKEPNDMVSIHRYSPLFNSHLRVCLDRQMLPVASDTVDFMLSKKLEVDHSLLQMLLHKLGKQNLWLRAREVFRHSLSTGYYSGVSAPPGFMALIVPCQLGEVELALTLEMFITVNATSILHLSESASSFLSITLKRTQSCEREYLSASSRILSAACIPQPKLVVNYTAVNSSQDQVFTLDIPSARCWLRHNHLWANEVWTH